MFTKRLLNIINETSWVQRYDVAYDLFDFIYLKNSDESLEKLKFHVSLREWTTTGMKMHISFRDPLSVSRGENSDIIFM